MLLFSLLFIHIPLKFLLQLILGLKATSTNGFHMIEQRSVKVVFKLLLYVGQLVSDCYHQSLLLSFSISPLSCQPIKFSMMPLLLRFQINIKKKEIEALENKSKIKNDFILHLNSTSFFLDIIYFILMIFYLFMESNKILRKLSIKTWRKID